MKDKIIKIIIFAVAILDCILALAFAFTFDDDKKDAFSQARLVQAENPVMMADLSTATPESLPNVVTKYQDELKNLNDSLKGKHKHIVLVGHFADNLQFLFGEADP